MAYASQNFKTKKALREAVAAGQEIRVQSPAEIWPARDNGTEYVEGPWYPEPHTWYAQVTVRDGVIVAVK